MLGGSAMDEFARKDSNNSSSTGLKKGFLGGILFSVFAIIYGGLISMTLFAFGEGVYLLILLEENTRKTALSIE